MSRTRIIAAAIALAATTALVGLPAATAAPPGSPVVHGQQETTTTPTGGKALVFDGETTYVTVPDSPALSIATTGQLSVEVLIRPDVLRGLPSTEGSSEGPIVHPLVKGQEFGDDGDQEWVLRWYDQDSERPNRLSAYAFNPEGGLGAGSYVQDDMRAGEWTHVAMVFDTVNKGADGWGTVRIYRDGVQRDVDSLGQDYKITPEDEGAPLFIGGDPDRSLFRGAIGPVVVHPTALKAGVVAAHARAALG